MTVPDSHVEDATMRVEDLDHRSIDHVLTTTRAVRRRLDLDRPVPLDVVHDCLEMALQAPTGFNRQNWRWLVITDPETRETLGDIVLGSNSRSSRW